MRTHPAEHKEHSGLGIASSVCWKMHNCASLARQFYNTALQPRAARELCVAALVLSESPHQKYLQRQSLNMKIASESHICRTIGPTRPVYVSVTPGVPVLGTLLMLTYCWPATRKSWLCKFLVREPFTSFARPHRFPVFGASYDLLCFV